MDQDPWDQAPAESGSDPWDGAPAEAPAAAPEGGVEKVLRSLAIPTQVRDAAAFGHPYQNAEDPENVVVDEPFAMGGSFSGKGYTEKKTPLVTPQDLKKALEGRGAMGGDYLARQGNPLAGPLGLGLDITAPGDPLGPVLGKGIEKSSDLFRAAGLRKLLGAMPFSKRPAAFQTLKEMGVAGGTKNQAKIVQEGIDALDARAKALIASAQDAGKSFDLEHFLSEGQSIVDDIRRYHPDHVANSVQQYLDILGRSAGGSSTLPLKEAARFKTEWGALAGGSDPASKGMQGLTGALRQGVVKGAGEDLGSGIDRAWAKESQLISMRPAANAATNSNWGKYAVPAAGAVMGGLSNAHLGDGLHAGDIGRGALWGVLGAKALTSPWFLTRGAQAFEAASPVLGRATAQGAYRLLPEEGQ